MLQGGGCNKYEKESAINQLISQYFHCGYQYKFIARFLERDGIKMSVRTLKRKLKSMNLQRKKQHRF